MDQGNTIKKDVQEFYDNIGWDKSDDGFSDASIYEDLRPVAAEYIQRCHQRVKQHLPDSGRYLLDVASGPVQYDDYVAYSAGYERRVCADISLRALVEARRRLGDKGLYVVADIANLPFADNTFDGVVSLHTIYHVPAAEQEKAFNEIHRVLAPERPAVVVYSWGARSPLMLLSLMPFQVWNWLSRRIRARTASQGDPIAQRSMDITTAIRGLPVANGRSLTSCIAGAASVRISPKFTPGAGSSDGPF
jgi:SAM-dependent methyltransferase